MWGRMCTLKGILFSFSVAISTPTNPLLLFFSLKYFYFFSFFIFAFVVFIHLESRLGTEYGHMYANSYVFVYVAAHFARFFRIICELFVCMNGWLSVFI